MTKRDELDAKLDFYSGILMSVEDDDERDKLARSMRRQLGTESRFSSSGKGSISRFWNWLIDADKTSLTASPLTWIVVLGFCAVFIISMGILIYDTYK